MGTGEGPEQTSQALLSDFSSPTQPLLCTRWHCPPQATRPPRCHQPPMVCDRILRKPTPTVLHLVSPCPKACALRPMTQSPKPEPSTVPRPLWAARDWVVLGPVVGSVLHSVGAVLHGGCSPRTPARCKPQACGDPERRDGSQEERPGPSSTCTLVPWGQDGKVAWHHFLGVHPPRLAHP